MQARLLCLAQVAYLELPQALMAAAFPLPPMGLFVAGFLIATVWTLPFVAGFLTTTAWTLPSAPRIVPRLAVQEASREWQPSALPHTALQASVQEVLRTRKPLLLRIVLSSAPQMALKEQTERVPGQETGEVGYELL